MIPKIWLINLLLAVLVIFFGVNAYQVWEEGVEPGRTATVATPGEEPGPAGKGERFAKRVMPAESAYDIIAADNLFSPDRKEILPEAEAPPEPIASADRLSTEKITLYGIILAKDIKKALIRDASKPAGENAQVWVSIGDAVSDLKVADIQEERILLAAGKKKYEILLHDESKAKSRKLAPPSAPRSGDSPTVITSEAPKPKQAPAAPAVQKNAVPDDKRMLDNPFRRKFPKQNP